MTLSVRLSPDETLALEQYCREHGTTKTAVVLRLLREHVLTRSKTPMQLAEDAGLIGMIAEEYPSDYAVKHSQYLKKKLRDKHARGHRSVRRRPPAA